MKTLLLLFVSLAIGTIDTPAQIIPRNGIPYEMRDVEISSEKFAKVLFFVNKTLSDDFRRQHLQNLIECRVMDIGKDGQILCRAGDRVILVRGVHLSRPIADGDVLKLSLKATGETFSYTTVLGAESTVHVLEATHEPDPMNAEEFVAKLKAGETFPMTTGERNTPCVACRGTGQGDMKSGNVRCPTCWGSGRVDGPVYYRIYW